MNATLAFLPSWPRLAADAILVLHLAFIVFACFGALLTLVWRWMPVVHLPAAVWGVYIELSGRLCPLTHLENHFRISAGQTGYTESFVEHYLLDIIYPPGLTRGVQFALAGGLLLLNIALYAWIARSCRARRRPAKA